MDDVKDLIEAEIPRLRRYARALLHNPVGADDLVQETLLRALEKASLWQKGSNLRAWLFTMLHHLHVNQVRKSSRAGRHVGLDEIIDIGRPAEQASIVELGELRAAMARLPGEQRAILLLIGLEGMGYSEAADILNIPVGTVRSRLSRARGTLRLLLDAPERACARRRDQRQPALAA
jgi:RNA polymerase sigma-70 factor (ECF subfamily)